MKDPKLMQHGPIGPKTYGMNNPQPTKGLIQLEKPFNHNGRVHLDTMKLSGLIQVDEGTLLRRCPSFENNILDNRIFHGVFTYPMACVYVHITKCSPSTWHMCSYMIHELRSMNCLLINPILSSLDYINVFDPYVGVNLYANINNFLATKQYYLFCRFCEHSPTHDVTTCEQVK